MLASPLTPEGNRSEIGTVTIVRQVDVRVGAVVEDAAIRS